MTNRKEKSIKWCRDISGLVDINEMTNSNLKNKVYKNKYVNTWYEILLFLIKLWFFKREILFESEFLGCFIYLHF